MRISKLILLLAAISLEASAQQPQKTSYVVLDGAVYKGEQLPLAASHPSFAEPALMSRDGWYSIRRSKDGHFNVLAFLNGFPVVFLVDTGATKSAVSMTIARNAGIKAGVAGQSQTANGMGSIALSSGNQLNVGPFAFSGVEILVTLNQAGPSIALLGMDVLKQFQILQTQDTLMLKKL